MQWFYTLFLLRARKKEDGKSYTTLHPYNRLSTVREQISCSGLCADATWLDELAMGATLASPKSRILACSRLVTKMFAGLTSRWTIPWECVVYGRLAGCGGLQCTERAFGSFSRGTDPFGSIARVADEAPAITPPFSDLNALHFPSRWADLPFELSLRADATRKQETGTRS
jgi:hypothetical protein